MKLSFLLAACLCFLSFSCASGEKNANDAQDGGGKYSKIRINPVNGLGAYLTIYRECDSARLELILNDETQFQRYYEPATKDSLEIVLAGLKPGKKYAIIIEGYLAGSSQFEEKLTVTTKPLPGDFPEFEFKSYQPSQGYVLTSFIKRDSKGDPPGYAVIIDMDGDVVWYRQFPGQVFYFEEHPNGNFIAFGNQELDKMKIDGHYYELDKMGEIVREYRAEQGKTDHHEFAIVENGYIIPSVSYDTVMLREIGLTDAGERKVVLQNDAVEYHKTNGEILRWSSLQNLNSKTLSHIKNIDELNDREADEQIENAKPWHLNSYFLDADGNLVAGFRNTNNIAKIDFQTGRILWELGGPRNSFQFINDSLQGFSMLHAPRRLSNGNLLVFDNGSMRKPQLTRVVEYKLDEKNKTAELVWDYRHPSGKVAGKRGNAKRLSNGNTLICYGTTPLIFEIDKNGNVLYEITGKIGHYRASKINSIE